MTKQEINNLSYQIVGAAIEVHKELGPGLYEELYELCMIEELKLREIKVERQVQIPIYYKGIPIKKNYFIDLLVEKEIILELKCVEELHPIHEVQLVTYLKMSDRKLGFLLNFNVPKMKSGIKRKVNHL